MLQPKQNAKEKKNLEDAKKMKNMRPTGPKTGRVKPTMGTAKNGTSMKKAQGGVKLPKALQKTGKPSLKNSGLIPSTSEEMSKVKKYSPSKEGFESVKDSTYKPSTRRYKNGGSMMAKNGKSFPDLNKDGKITKADVLKGRGVIAKKGATVKKAMMGAMAKPMMKSGGSMKKCKYGCK